MPLDALADVTFRARRVLYAVVTEYIAVGEPVGSRTLSKRYGLDLSAATIRNVLADLEEGGFLSQPHTSAGRVPTDKGFRAFVDALVQMRQVTDAEQAEVSNTVSNLQTGQADWLREVGKLLSTLTGAAAVVAPPAAADAELERVQFVPLQEGRFLAVLVSTSGTVQNRMVQFPKLTGEEDLDRLHRYLRRWAPGRTLRQLRDRIADETEQERGDYRELATVARAMVDATLRTAERATEVRLTGRDVLFARPEFEDPETVRTFMKAFEDKETLLEMLDRTLAGDEGAQVRIGDETSFTPSDGVSFVSSTYAGSGDAQGALGVLGTSRLDYARVLPIVEMTARAMAQRLRGDDDEEKEFGAPGVKGGR